MAVRISATADGSVPGPWRKPRVAAQRLPGRVAGHRLERPVDVDDRVVRPGGVGDADPLHERLHGPLPQAQRFFRLSALRDVHRGADVAGDAAAGVAEAEVAGPDVADGAVGAHDAVFVFLLRPLLVLHDGGRPLAVVFGDALQPGIRPLVEARAGTAPQPLVAGVDVEGSLAVAGEHEKDLLDLVRDLPQQFLGLPAGAGAADCDDRRRQHDGQPEHAAEHVDD